MGEKRRSEDDADADTESGEKKIKFRDMESVLRSEGVSASLNLYSGGLVQSHNNLVGDDMPALETNQKRLHSDMKMNKEHGSTLKRSSSPDLDLNTANNTKLMDHNPFYPYKKMDPIECGSTTGSVDPIECGSTTGSVEDNEHLKLWKEMKQNGFLSSSSGGLVVSKKQGRPPKRRKKDEHKKKMELAKREQFNRFTNIVPPSGLLSGLNPGIINHVRNRKQVISIIKAVLESEKMEGKNHNEDGSTRDEKYDGKIDQNILGSAVGHLRPCSSRSSTFSSYECEGKGGGLTGIPENRVYHENSVGLQFSLKCKDHTLEPKLLSASTVASENASCMSYDELSVTQESINSLSRKGATVASQWLDLLYRDIKGRLTALRSSRKRVQNVIETDLPYLLSTELSHNQENNPLAQSSHATAVSDSHVTRWKSIFNQMGNALCDEGKQLEEFLKQVKEMRSDCDKGLKSSSVDGLALGSSNNSRLKNAEAWEEMNAIKAAAASIYSTCDFIMGGNSVREREHLAHVHTAGGIGLTKGTRNTSSFL